MRAFEAIGCEGLARVDVFVTPDGEVVVNEINTMPGFTQHSMFPRMWAASGVRYPELIDRLISLARSGRSACAEPLAAGEALAGLHGSCVADRRGDDRPARSTSGAYAVGTATSTKAGRPIVVKIRPP